MREIYFYFRVHFKISHLREFKFGFFLQYVQIVNIVSGGISDGKVSNGDVIMGIDLDVKDDSKVNPSENSEEITGFSDLFDGIIRAAAEKRKLVIHVARPRQSLHQTGSHLDPDKVRENF